MKKFDLNIEKVLEDWEIFHGWREVISNAIDEQLLTKTDDIRIFKDRKGYWHISALVVNRQEGIPGPGFFELAATLGKLSREATSQERKAFWEKEQQAVHSTIWRVWIRKRLTQGSLDCGAWWKLRHASYSRAG